MNDFFLFVLLAVLLICTAMMAAAETAFFSLKPNEKDQLKKDDSKVAQIVKKMLDNPKQLLATTLIALNFANIAIVLTVSNILKDFVDEENNEMLFFILEVFVSTFVILLIGEVIPKIYASKNNLKTAYFLAIPLNFLNNLPPFSWLRAGMVTGSDFIGKYARKKGVKISSDELEQAIALTKEESTLDEEHKILEGIVKFGNKDVKQIMTQRLNVSALDVELNYLEVLEKIREYGYSRIPVFEGNFDNIVGILFVKDLLSHLDEGVEFNWKELVRKPFFIPENKKIDDLLKDFQSRKVHMAVVVDEYGGASGVVTLEDVLEEIVGEITDEFDEKEINYKKINDHTFLVEGKTALIDFYKLVGIEGKNFENYKGESDSIGGFLVENAGKILRNKESFIFENIKFIVESSDKRKIKTIRVELPNEIEI